MIVTVIAPCRNEIRYIDGFIESILAQKHNDFEIELIIADGESDDGTAERLEFWSAQEDHIRPISNPGRIVSTGLNAALMAAKGEILVRMDIHTVYEPDYIAQCVNVLRSTGATCVGGAWQARGTTGLQRAISDAFESPLGSGGAKSRRVNYEGVCDTVYLGCWWREDLIALGGFDETLIRNQDDELCLRIRKRGGTIWQSPTIKSYYAPRPSYLALFRQFFQYGYWKVLVAKKHRAHGSWRHMVPFFALFCLMLMFILSFFYEAALLLTIFGLLSYCLLVTVAGALASSEQSTLGSVRVAWAIACMHAAYGAGYALGLKDFLFGSGRARATMGVLTR